HLTPDEKKRERQIQGEIMVLDEEITVLKEQEEKRKQKAFGKMNQDQGLQEEDENKFFDFQIKKSVPVNKVKPIQDFVLRNYDVHEDLRKADVYAVMAALATGKPKDEITARAMGHVAKGATTSVMLTEFLSSQLLDGGLSHSHVVRSGANVFTMNEPTTRWVKITTYPTFEWKAESASTTDKTVVFSDVEFSAKTFRGFVTCSGEQLQDAHNINSALRTVFNRSVANSIDTACLFGSGTGAEPQGIVNYSNVNNYDANGLITSYDPFIYAMALVADDNGLPEEKLNTSIMTPNVWRQLQLMIDANYNPLQRPPVLANHRFLHTTKPPDNLLAPGNRTTIVMGGFDSLNIGVRLQTQVVITPVQADTFEYSFFVAFRGDVKPTREESFAIITDVYAPDTIT
ncbi:MAG: phage major capsid protein, partial [Cyclobacteriaceae bacterium]